MASKLILVFVGVWSFLLGYIVGHEKVMRQAWRETEKYLRKKHKKELEAHDGK